MKTTYQYKFYLDTNQKLELNDWLRISRYWYNRQLGERFSWWQDNHLQLPKKGRGQEAEGRRNKIYFLPSATGFKAPKFIYEKNKKIFFRDT
jgi:hypothetical protein